MIQTQRGRGRSGGQRPPTVLCRQGTTRVVAVALMLSAFGLTGCGVVKEASKIVHDVEGNKATIDAFTNKVQSGEAATFEATYVTTGSSPTTIVYAVQPPQGLAFKETPVGRHQQRRPHRELDRGVLVFAPVFGIGRGVGL